MTINWQEVTPKAEAILVEKVQPVLDRYGAKLLRKNYNDRDYIRAIIVIEYKGEEINVPKNAFEQPEGELAWFLFHFDQVKEIAARFANWPDPFHSDIYRFFRNKWGERRGQRPIDDRKNPIQMGYGYVCDAVEKAGSRVWGD